MHKTYLNFFWLYSTHFSPSSRYFYAHSTREVLKLNYYQLTFAPLVKAINVSKISHQSFVILACFLKVQQQNIPSEKVHESTTRKANNLRKGCWKVKQAKKSSLTILEVNVQFLEKYISNEWSLLLIQREVCKLEQTN